MANELDATRGTPPWRETPSEGSLETRLGELVTPFWGSLDTVQVRQLDGVVDTKHEKQRWGGKVTTCQRPAGGPQDAVSRTPR